MASSAGFEKGSGGAGTGTCFLAGDGAPIVGVGGEEARAALDAFMGFDELLHRGHAFADDDVAGLDAVIGDLAFVQRGEKAAFADDEDGAAGIGFAEEVRGVQRGGVEVAGGEPVDAEMFEAHGEILGSGRGVVGEKKKGRARGTERLHEFHRARNQLVFTVDDAVHVDQITGFHDGSFNDANCSRRVRRL